MKTIVPNKENVIKLMNGKVGDKPIIMVNLLRFNEKADYTGVEKNHVDYGKDCSGRRAYKSYSKEVIKLLWEVGGQILWLGNVRDSLIIPEHESWDEVALVYYPSREAFKRMVTSDAYQQIVHHRSAALDDSRLIETKAQRLPKMILSAAKGAFRLKSLFKPKIGDVNVGALDSL